MAGPWEAFQSSGAPAGPWTAFQSSPTPAAERGPATQGVFGNIQTGIENTLSAAEQRTTPNMGAQEKNLLGEGTVDEEGNLLIKGPNGQLIPTDQGQHVALRDPATGKVQVFGRSEATNEGGLTGLSRVAMTGMGAGAPAGRAVAGAVAAAKPVAPVVEAGERLGVEIPRAIATDSRAAQMLGQGVQQLPFSGSRLATKVGQTVEGLGNKLDEVAAGFGGETTVGAGQKAGDAITDWITGASKANVSKLYDKVDEAVNPLVKTEVPHTAEVASNILNRRVEATIPGEGTVKLLREAIASNASGGMTFKGMKDLRSYLGEMTPDQLVASGLHGPEVKQLYGALTKDLQTAAYRSGGPEGALAFERANTYARATAGRREALAKIVGSKGDAAPERVFDQLYAMAGSNSRANIGKLAQARKAMGAEDWNGFVSGVVQKLGGEEFSPLKFLTAYNKLDPSAKSILFRSTGRGDLAQHLEDIATISQKWKQFDKLGNPSGTARNVFSGGSVLAAAGGLIEPTTLITGLVGGRIMARVLSNPATAAPVARFSRAYAALAKAPSGPSMASLNTAIDNLVKNLADKLGVNLSPADVIRAIQGPVKAPAQNEQQEPAGIFQQ